MEERGRWKEKDQKKAIRQPSPNEITVLNSELVLLIAHGFHAVIQNFLLD